MTNKPSDHSNIPKDCTAVLSHSKFGSEVGYSHYVHKDEEQKGIYYLGLVLTEKHGGAPGRGHGGVTMAMLDEVMGRAASRVLGKMCYTASMTTNFCSGSKIGDHLLASATVSRSGKTLAFVDAQLHSGDHLVATATGSWINSGKDIPAP
jgi:acyl-coenzyme A thioesterase PaaI-like protein